jgi:hypothetical protein
MVLHVTLLHGHFDHLICQTRVLSPLPEAAYGLSFQSSEYEERKQVFMSCDLLLETLHIVKWSVYTS